MASFQERFKGKTSKISKNGIIGVILNNENDNPIQKAALYNLQNNTNSNQDISNQMQLNRSK